LSQSGFRLGAGRGELDAEKERGDQGTTETKDARTFIQSRILQTMIQPLAVPLLT